MTQKPNIGLTWIGKENRPRLETRILLEHSELSYRTERRVSDKGKAFLEMTP